MIKILVAYERFGVVRDAFRGRGADAWSCDLVSAPGHHIAGDAVEAILSQPWDIIIMHPPCTALCCGGNAYYAKGKAQYQERLEAIEYTLDVYKKAQSVCSKVCMENPVGVLPVKATQFIQPWQFGHPESKKTGLWLHGLPKLVPTDILRKPDRGYWDNQSPSGNNKLGETKDRAMLRAKTYRGIAEAMADQWMPL